MSFATVLCLIPENVYGAPVKIAGMDWQLVASYFTVKSTDIFYSVVVALRQREVPFETFLYAR